MTLEVPRGVHALREQRRPGEVDDLRRPAPAVDDHVARVNGPVNDVARVDVGQTGRDSEADVEGRLEVEPLADEQLRERRVAERLGDHGDAVVVALDPEVAHHVFGADERRDPELVLRARERARRAGVDRALLEDHAIPGREACRARDVGTRSAMDRLVDLVPGHEGHRVPEANTPVACRSSLETGEPPGRRTGQVSASLAGGVLCRGHGRPPRGSLGQSVVQFPSPALRSPLMRHSRRAGSEKIRNPGSESSASVPSWSKCENASRARAPCPRCPAAAPITHQVNSQSRWISADCVGLRAEGECLGRLRSKQANAPRGAGASVTPAPEVRCSGRASSGTARAGPRAPATRRRRRDRPPRARRSDDPATGSGSARPPLRS